MALTNEIGTTGLKQAWGVIQEDFLRELQGKEGYKRYNEMRLNSPVVGALLAAYELSIRGAEWNIESDIGEGDPRVEFCKEALESLSWSSHISEALTMLPFGYSLFEIVYQRDGGQLNWAKIGVRGQDTLEHWEFDDAGEVVAFWQRAAPKYELTRIPLDKCILYRTRVERNNPEGRSMLRTAWVPFYYEKNLQQLEAISLERGGAGFPVISMPETADVTDSSGSDKGIAEKAVRNIRIDEQAGFVEPAGWKLRFEGPTGSRVLDFDVPISRYDSRILMSCLTQFLLLGQDRVGTQALSSDQTDFFNMASNSIADIIAKAFTEQALAKLLELNGFDPDGVYMTHSPVGDVDIVGIADFLQKTSGLITWTAQDETWLRDVAKLPDLAPEDIEAERERKQAIAMEIARQRPQLASQNQPPPDNEEQMSADLVTMYAMDAPPDDVRRRFWERKTEAAFRGLFREQQERVMRGARGIKRHA